jgi:hypothetical protein
VHVVEKDVFNAWIKRAKDGNYEVADLERGEIPIAAEQEPLESASEDQKEGE